METKTVEKNGSGAAEVKKHKGKRSKARKIVMAAIALVIAFCVADAAVVTTLMLWVFDRTEYSDTDLYYGYDHYEAAYPRERVTFMSGENTLCGYIYGADNDKGLVVFAHGLGCGHEDYINVIVWFVDNGYRVFAYDATGSCTSEGSGTLGLVQSALDLDCALTFVENDSSLCDLPVFLFGHSWGGYAVAAVLNFDHDIAAVVSVSGYAEPMEMLLEGGESMIGAAVWLAYPFIWLYNKIAFGEYSDLSAIDGINSTDTPVLIFHGDDDETVGYDGASIISKSDRITNPYVQYITYSTAGQNGHATIFHTTESLDCIAAGEEADADVLNAVNADMMERTNELFEAQL